ncbi:TPA: hypothetical protein HA372_06485 [Candidatus Woesearchaeota archaeon]|nr:MAG: hypothetical protein QT04_C0044G0017 [archaeon GW2011_AR11]HIH05458.1 hypothetical protein [Candidatus Woesearchaeota archaeon]HIJ19306.1 hypothetical protein [Candidatus Woesearchaeota archaeon]
MMIERIRELMRVKDDIDAVKAKIDEHTSSVAHFSKEMESLKKELGEARALQQEMLSEMRDSLGMFSTIREDLSKEVYDFKLLKAQLQKKLLDKFEEELKQELTLNMEVLRKDISDYEEMKNSVKEMLKKTELVKQEMGKWLDISGSIKAADFELHRFARQLQQADSEKLELMRKIDTLERLVSKMRRGMPAMH